MRKLLIPSFTVLAVSLTACGGSAESDTGDAEAIKIGVISSESGYGGWLGETERRAIETLAEQVNSEGGIDGAPLEILFRDDQSDPEQAVNHARELVDEGIVALIGASLTPQTLAIAPIAAEEEIPLISMAGGYQPADSATDPWGWSVVAGIPPAVTKVLEYAESSGLTRLATITPTDAHGDLSDATLSEFLEGDGEYADRIDRVAHEKVNLEDNDFRAQLQSINAENPDLVFIGVSGELSVAIRKQMDEIGMDMPAVTYHSNTTSQVLGLLEGVEGEFLLPGTAVNIPDGLPAGDLKDEVLAFIEAYGEVTDEVPMATEGFGYDALKVVVDALRAVGPDSAGIKEWLDEGQEIVGINYVMQFSADDHSAGTAADLSMMTGVPGEGWVVVEE